VTANKENDTMTNDEREAYKNLMRERDLAIASWLSEFDGTGRLFLKRFGIVPADTPIPAYVREYDAEGYLIDPPNPYRES
jgi:hypothetical protein